MRVKELIEKENLKEVTITRKFKSLTKFCGWQDYEECLCLEADVRYMQDDLLNKTVENSYYDEHNRFVIEV